MENSQERKHLREYREAFEKLKKTEQKRDTIATALKTVAPDSAGTASLRKSLRQLEETIARYESRLAKLESTKPLQALLTRLRQEELVAKAAKYDILSTKDAYNIGGKRDVEKVDFQFFANKGIKKQNNRELNKSILSWEANIKKHRAKIENPAKYDAEWHKKTKQQQAGLIRHWEKEIKTSEENVKEAKEELKRREFEE